MFLVFLLLRAAASTTNQAEESKINELTRSIDILIASVEELKKCIVSKNCNMAPKSTMLLRERNSASTKNERNEFFPRSSRPVVIGPMSDTLWKSKNGTTTF